MTGIEKETRPCPECGEDRPVWTVKKAGPNRGRPFISCPECDAFAWCDLRPCPTCGATLFVAQVKKGGPNLGRRFRACPRRCQKAFEWLD
jgi:transcription elongation factor Elf1